MAAKWIVLKFGGTSVASRPNWEAIASLARDRQAEGFRVLLVCSAVAGVTDCLNELADRPAGHAGLNEILDLHRALGRELGVQEGARFDVDYYRTSHMKLVEEKRTDAYAAQLEAYLAYVRDGMRFKESISFDVDAYGLELSIKRADGVG